MVGEGGCFKWNQHGEDNCSYPNAEVWQQCFCLNSVWSACLVFRIKARINPLVDWSSLGSKKQTNCLGQLMHPFIFSACFFLLGLTVKLEPFFPCLRINGKQIPRTGRQSLQGNRTETFWSTTQAVLTQGSLILNSSSRLYFYCRLRLGQISLKHTLMTLNPDL